MGWLASCRRKRESSHHESVNFTLAKITLAAKTIMPVRSKQSYACPSKVGSSRRQKYTAGHVSAASVKTSAGVCVPDQSSCSLLTRTCSVWRRGSVGNGERGEKRRS